ncbi:hypothetical protein OE88DRAFT_1729203 [Heliocybe sulcata]|uniref:Uncharacterized protein n=1 Tax=Heliocybe sulcata TaxID=5364 RepID=A0A5C3MN40_9AGAM|nr:hypothetical protein OE88DRAFT_1729203 [Heliocybe sulcata]
MSFFSVSSVHRSSTLVIGNAEPLASFATQPVCYRTIACVPLVPHVARPWHSRSTDDRSGIRRGGNGRSVSSIAENKSAGLGGGLGPPWTLTLQQSRLPASCEPQLLNSTGIRMSARMRTRPGKFCRGDGARSRDLDLSRGTADLEARRRKIKEDERAGIWRGGERRREDGSVKTSLSSHRCIPAPPKGPRLINRIDVPRAARHDVNGIVHPAARASGPNVPAPSDKSSMSAYIRAGIGDARAREEEMRVEWYIVDNPWAGDTDARKSSPWRRWGVHQDQHPQKRSGGDFRVLRLPLSSVASLASLRRDSRGPEEPRQRR